MKQFKKDIKFSILLLAFLRREKVLTRFMKNLSVDFNRNYKGCIFNVSQGFRWSGSPEGLDYWSRFNSKFHREIYESSIADKKLRLTFTQYKTYRKTYAKLNRTSG